MQARGLLDGLALDVGSTTVKLVAARDGAIVVRAYRRHRGRCREEARTLLDEATAVVGRVPRFITGSAGAALAGPLGAAYVHEVHAIAAAARATMPRARTVIELGGQDAKMIHIDGEGRFTSEMNERCAAGTGATLDRCLHRLGLDERALAALRVDPGDLPVVSAKCGVFAESDLVSLARSGLDRERVLAALLDAIVRSNLAVLARGRPLLPPVVLLGGPHAFVPALASLWRQHLAVRWREHGVCVDGGGGPLDDANGEVVVPPDAALFAAIGALASAAEIARVKSARGAGAAHSRGRLGIVSAARARPDEPAPPVRTRDEVEAVLAAHACPPPRSRATGRRLWLGVDAGSTTLKAVVLDEDALPVALAYRRAAGSPLDESRALLGEIAQALGERTAAVAGLGVTGYAADLLGPTFGADAAPVETLAHARAALRFVPDADVVCDVGGQDIKVLILDGSGGVRDFHLSSQCAAGNGALLEAAASDLGVPMERFAEVAFSARRAPGFSAGCAVFLDTERVNAQKLGYSPAEILAGMTTVLPRNVWESVASVPSLPALGRTFVLSGGVQRNAAAVIAQLEYLEERHPSARVVVHPFPGEAGAIGAALAARDACGSGASRFIGFARAAATHFRTRSDEATRCRRCPSSCSRTLVSSVSDGGGRADLVTGHGCDSGATLGRRRGLPLTQPSARNLLRFEAARLFGHRAPVVVVSSAGSHLRIALPRVLGLYRSAPLLLHYLQAIGVPRAAIVTGEPTSPPLWRRFAGRGTVDACFPVKAVQAHVAELLARRDEHPFDVLLYPVLTHAVTTVTGTADTASCPVVAGTPFVTRAAFGVDAEGRLPDGTLLLTPVLALTRPAELRASLFAAMRRIAPALTLAEHEAALAGARRAQSGFEDEMEQAGASAIANAARSGRAAIVLLARPYHADPGLHHEIGAELAALGRTTFSVRALPRRADVLRALGLPPIVAFDGAAAALTNSGAGEKLAAARMVAAHPHLVAIELSSFKCGQDAALYGAIADAARAGGKPFLALHDLDETRPTASLRLRLRTFLDAVARWDDRLARAGALPPRALANDRALPS